MLIEFAHVYLQSRLSIERYCNYTDIVSVYVALDQAREPCYMLRRP